MMAANMADVYRVHAELVLPIVRSHMQRVLAAQWVMLASGTTDSSTHVLLADMCTRATHKLCTHALRLVMAELPTPKRGVKVQVEGGLGTVLGWALNISDQPSISAEKLDSLVQEEVRQRVNITLAPWHMAPPLYVPTAFTKTDVLAKMVLLACGALKVYLSKVSPQAYCFRSFWRLLGGHEAPKSGNACMLDQEETLEAVTQILCKWTSTGHVLSEQEVTKAAVGIVEMIAKDLHYPDPTEGGHGQPPRPHFNLALIKDPLSSFFQSSCVEPTSSAEISRQRNFLHFCHRKFDEMMCELEMIRYQCMLPGREQGAHTPRPHFESPPTFKEIRSLLEDVFCEGAALAGDGRIDMDGLGREADRFSHELANRMYCYMTANRTPVQSLEVWRHFLEPLVLEVDQKTTNYLQVVMKILEDSAKKFVQQLLLWIKMEPATRRNHADKVYGCLTDIHAFVTGTATHQRRLEDAPHSPESPSLDAIGDSLPGRTINSGTLSPETKLEAYLQDTPRPQDTTGDSFPDDEVTSTAITPERKLEVQLQDAPRPQDTTGDSCPDKVLLGTTIPEDKLEVHLQDAPRPQDTTGDSCTESKINSTTRTSEKKRQVHFQDSPSPQDSTGDSCSDEEVTSRTMSSEAKLEIDLQDAPKAQDLSGDSCSDEEVTSRTMSPEAKLEANLQDALTPQDTTGEYCSDGEGSPKPVSSENNPEVCLQHAPEPETSPQYANYDSCPEEITHGSKTSGNTLEMHLQEPPPRPISPPLDTIGNSCSNKVNSGTTSPQIKPEVCFQEDLDAFDFQSPHPDDSCPEAVIPRTEIPETKPDMDIQEPKTTVLDMTTNSCSSPPEPPPVPEKMVATARTMSLEVQVDTQPSDTWLPYPPPAQANAPTQNELLEMNDSCPKTPPTNSPKDLCPAKPRPFSKQDSTPLMALPLDVNLEEQSVQQRTVSTRSMDSSKDTTATPTTVKRHCRPSLQEAMNLGTQPASQPRSPPLQAPTSPFRPMCTAHEELLTLVDVLMVQLFAGLPKYLCRLVHSSDTLSTVHRVSKRMTGDGVLLSWTKLGPCKVNQMVKEVIRELKHEFSSAQRLVDVFLTDRDMFENVLFKLLMSKLDSLHHKQDDTRARLQAVGGVFLSTFCMRPESED